MLFNNMSKWYIVKSNWPQINQFVGASSMVKKFAGLGGDIWPLDSLESSEARKKQSKIDNGRCYLDIGKSFQIYVVTNFALSEEYFKIAKKIISLLCFSSCPLLVIKKKWMVMILEIQKEDILL